MRFTKISRSTFDELQVEAGVLLKNFDPTTGAFADEDILTATTGGITVNITPSFSDFGEDVDNCPNNTMELKRIDDVDVNVTTTAINISESNIKYMLGAADTDAETGAIKVRKTLNTADFKTIWYVGDMANGGFVAIKIINALSTGGFSLKTSKKGKGNVSITLTGHFSIENVEDVPVEIYLGGAEESFIAFNKQALNLNVGDVAILDIEYNPASLADDALCNLTTDASPVKGAFTTDKKQLIVTASDTVTGEANLMVYVGAIQAHCTCTVVDPEAEDTEGEG